MTETNAHGEGLVVTFYSYKGGIGRSMALANVAWILASRGKRVLTVDWDLEAPGLHRYFSPFLADQNLRRSRGIIDMVWSFAAATLRPGDDQPGWHQKYVEIPRYALRLAWPFQDGGLLDFVPAGRQDAAYARWVGTFDWRAFYERQSGAEFLEALRAAMTARYDYVLIDSRTGLSDTAGICTVELPDVLVDCFTLSTQSVDGAAAVARSASTLRAGRPSQTPRPLRVVPVPMRVEDAELHKLELSRDYARGKFEPFLSDLSDAARERYWGEIEVPYKPFYAYEEVLATVGDRPRQESSLLASFERLASQVTSGEVRQLGPFTEPDRRRLLASFERRAGSQEPDLAINYVELDRPWATWITATLESAGYRVLLVADDPRLAARVAELERTAGVPIPFLVVLSPDYVGHPWAEGWWRDATAGRLGAVTATLGIAVSDAYLPDPFDAAEPVDLAVPTGEAAKRRLLAAVAAFMAARPPGSPREAEAPSAADEDRRPRFPGALPPVWQGVPQRNSGFTGRGEALRSLRERLTSRPGGAVVAVRGLAGVGKTQLVTEYLAHYKSDYDLVWWVATDEAGGVEARVAALAPHLDLDPERDDRSAVESVVNALRRGEPFRRWLLVLDGVDQPEDYARFFPSSHGLVVLTSRNRSSTGVAEPLDLDEFEREESIEFLSSRGVGHADAVAAALGDLPLALEQAAAWLTGTGMSTEDYLELARSHATELLSEATDGGHPTSLAASIGQCLDRVEGSAPTAARLMELYSCLAPALIPSWFAESGRLAATIGTDVGRESPLLSVGRAIRELGRFSLIRAERGGVVLPIAVRALVMERIEPDRRPDVLRDARLVLTAVDAGDPDDAGRSARYAELVDHVEATGAAGETDSPARGLGPRVSRWLAHRGETGRARALLEQSIRSFSRTVGPDDPATLAVRASLAGQGRVTGWTDAARDLARQVRADCARILGPGHPLTLRATLTDLVAARGATPTAEGTRAEFAGLLSQFSAQPGPGAAGGERPAALTAALSSWASTLLALGEPVEALEAARAADTDARRRFGTAHLVSCACAITVGNCLAAIGDHPAGRANDEETIRNYRRRFGDDHPFVMVAAANLAVDLREAGEEAGSEILREDSLARLRAVFGDVHRWVDAARARERLTVDIDVPETST